MLRRLATPRLPMRTRERMDPLHPFLVVPGDKTGTSVRMRPRKTDPRSQQVWHDKHPSLFKSRTRYRHKFLAFHRQLWRHLMTKIFSSGTVNNRQSNKQIKPGPLLFATNSLSKNLRFFCWNICRILCCSQQDKEVLYFHFFAVEKWTWIFLDS